MKFVAVKSCQGSLGKNKGTEFAPDLILKETNKLDLKIPEDDIIKTAEILEKSDGDFFVGGDHSITYGLFKGFAKKFKKSGLIVFDAHPDCVNNFSPPTHEDLIRVLVEENIVKPENLLLIGLRKIHKIEKIFLDSKKIKYIQMKHIKNLDILVEGINSFANKFDRLYLSLDIDVLDASLVPGTGYPEKNGFKMNDLLYVLKRIKRLNIKRIDLVEVNPLKDKNNKTVDSAKKIISVFK